MNTCPHRNWNFIVVCPDCGHTPNESDSVSPREQALLEVLQHIRRCVRFEPSMNAAVVCIHEGSATMAQIDAALALAAPAAQQPPRACPDGGKCHHDCKDERYCWRRDTGACVPLSASGLRDDWTAAQQPVADAPPPTDAMLDGIIANAPAGNESLVKTVARLAYNAGRVADGRADALPREPTEQMLHVGVKNMGLMLKGDRARVAAIYRAMYDAYLAQLPAHQNLTGD